MITARVWLNSIHASLQHDLCQVFEHLGMTVVNGNMDRSFEERPAVKGIPALDFGEEIRGRVNTLTCIESDFAGCDMIFMMNPSDFHQRIEHFAKFRPTVCYVHGQWVNNQMDELAAKINGQFDRGEQPRMWVACYSKVEEEYLRPRIYKQLQDRIHHIRFCKKAGDYSPWLFTSKPTAPQRHHHVFTTCNDFKARDKACNYDEWKLVTKGMNYRLAGRRSEELGGLGLISFDQLRQEFWDCAVYLGVPCWPAPLVMSLSEAMLSGCPVAYYDNGRGAAHEGIFDDKVGCCSSDIAGLRSFLFLCLKDKEFQQEQSAKSYARAEELFGFPNQVEKWRVLFGQMQELWK